MSTNDFLARALVSLQQTVAIELRDDLSSGRNREFAACAGRVLARLQTDIAAAPTLARDRLERWRSLSAVALVPSAVAPAPNAAAPTAGQTAPVEELLAHAAQVARTLEEATPPTAAWFKEAVSAARDYHTAYERALPTPSARTAGGPAQPDSQRERLTRYLAMRYPGLPSDPLRSLRIVPGGRGKETSLFELVPNQWLPSRLVLRRDLTLSVTGTSAYAEFPLLQRLAALGLPVPTPILAEKEPAHLGGSFIIMTEIENARAGGELFAELNDLSLLAPSFAPDLVRALAQLHTVRDHFAPGADPLDMVRGFQQMFRGIVDKPPLHVATDLGFAWLLAHPLPKSRPQRLVHGDVGLHNLLVRDGNLAAILDWELAHLGDPAEDIAYAWSPLLRHLLTWDEFVAGYREHGGEPEAYDRHAVAWYSVWAHTRNSVYVAMHYDWAANGQRRDIECFNAGTDFFARTQYYIALELDEALKDTHS